MSRSMNTRLLGTRTSSRSQSIYVRLLPVPKASLVLTEKAWWILAVVVGVLTILFAINHDRIVDVSSNFPLTR
jgi:hypothetical protein